MWKVECVRVWFDVVRQIEANKRDRAKDKINSCVF